MDPSIRAEGRASEEREGPAGSQAARRWHSHGMKLMTLLDFSRHNTETLCVQKIRDA